MHYFVNLWRNEKVKLYKFRRGTAEAFVYSLRFRRPRPNRLMCTLCAKSCVRCTVLYLQWLMCTLWRSQQFRHDFLARNLGFPHLRAFTMRRALCNQLVRTAFRGAARGLAYSASCTVSCTTGYKASSSPASSSTSSPTCRSTMLRLQGQQPHRRRHHGQQFHKGQQLH